MTLGQYVLPTSSDSPVCRRSKAVLSWAAWVLSVLATSALLNYLSNSGFLSLFSSLGTCNTLLLPSYLRPES